MPQYSHPLLADPTQQMMPGMPNLMSLIRMIHLMGMFPSNQAAPSTWLSQPTPAPTPIPYIQREDQQKGLGFPDSIFDD